MFYKNDYQKSTGALKKAESELQQQESRPLEIEQRKLAHRASNVLRSRMQLRPPIAKAHR